MIQMEVLCQSYISSCNGTYGRETRENLSPLAMGITYRITITVVSSTREDNGVFCILNFERTRRKSIHADLVDWLASGHIRLARCKSEIRNYYDTEDDVAQTAKGHDFHACFMSRYKNAPIELGHTVLQSLLSY
jgi:hypothetical protein